MCAIYIIGLKIVEDHVAKVIRAFDARSETVIAQSMFITSE